MKSLPGVTQLLRLAKTDSTQAVARFLAEQGAPHGTLVWADRQSAGRGRLKRRWSSGPGGLYVSLVLRPDIAPARLAALSVAAAAAAARAIAGVTGLRTAVKPPNDVYAESPRGPRKVCGILAEASGGARHVDWVVLGVGVNVNNALPGLPRAASLKGLTGRRWNLETILSRLLRELAVGMRRLRPLARAERYFV